MSFKFFEVSRIRIDAFFLLMISFASSQEPLLPLNGLHGMRVRFTQLYSSRFLMIIY